MRNLQGNTIKIMAGMVSWAQNSPMHISHLSECEHSVSPRPKNATLWRFINGLPNPHAPKARSPTNKKSICFADALFVAGWWIRKPVKKTPQCGVFRAWAHAVFALRQVREVHWRILYPTNHPRHYFYSIPLQIPQLYAIINKNHPKRGLSL